MARAKQFNPFANASNRKKLAGGTEHWTPADEGISLGYRRGKTKSVWYVRRYLGGGKYEQRPIGLANDFQDADGEDVLTYYQAQDRAKARAREAVKQTRPLPRRQGYTVQDAVDDYMAHYKANSGKQTVEMQRVFDRDVTPALGTRPVADLTRQELMSWRDGLIRQKPRNRSRQPVTIDDVPASELKRRRKATAQRKWTCLRSALNHAFAAGHVDQDGTWRSIKPLTGIDPPPPTRILTTAECKRVTNKLESDFRPIGQATYLTGAAFKELRETTVDDYMPESGHLRVFNTKRRARLVPLTQEGKRLFDSLTAGKSGDEFIFTDSAGLPWGKSSQARRMKAASKAAKINPPVNLTDLRDAYGSLLLNAGVSLEVVSKAMGHASTETTRKHYAHLLQGTVDKAIRDALPSLGIKSKVRRLS